MSRWDLRMFLRYDAGGGESGSFAHTSSSLNGAESLMRMDKAEWAGASATSLSQGARMTIPSNRV